MRKILLIVAALALLSSCSKKEESHDYVPTIDTTEMVTDSITADTIAIDTTAATAPETTHASKRHHKVAENESSSDDDGYILGFDDDVDDSHDMELYMEDTHD